MRNPRINVVVSQRAYDSLKRCSKATGDSVSRTVGELVELVTPVLERVAALSEMAEGAKREVAKGLESSLGEMESSLQPVLNRAYSLLGVDSSSLNEFLQKRPGESSEGTRARAPAPSRLGGSLGSETPT